MMRLGRSDDSKGRLRVAEPVKGSGTLGGAHPRVDARGKVTGRAHYAADLSVPGVLHASTRSQLRMLRA
jgi:hypothetical protein